MNEAYRYLDGIRGTPVSMLVRACIFVGRFHAPFSAFFEVLATSLGRILFRGRISLVNAPKNTSDKAFSVKNHVVFSDPPNTDRQIIIFVQNVWLNQEKILVSVDTVKFVAFWII